MNRNSGLVSVIIPTYNRAEMVSQCVESVLSSDYQNLEVIVVDNASTDGTDSVLLSHFAKEPRLKILRLSCNLMAAGGRNAGMGEANGEYLLLLDNDNVVHPDMISHLVQAFGEKPGADFMGALSVNVHSGTIWVLQGGYVNFRTSRTWAVGEGIPYCREEEDAMAAASGTREEGNPHTAGKDNCFGRNSVLQRFYETMGAPNAFMIRRKVLDTIGGFDESYYAMYEEVDFAYRMKEAGMKAYLCTEAVTDHYGYTAEGQNSRLRNLGIETPERAYHFAKNRFTIERRFASKRQKIIFRLFFSNIFTIFYEHVARSEGREDIAKAYRRGAIEGAKTLFRDDSSHLFQPYRHKDDLIVVK